MIKYQLGEEKVSGEKIVEEVVNNCEDYIYNLRGEYIENKRRIHLPIRTNT